MNIVFINVSGSEMFLISLLFFVILFFIVLKLLKYLKRKD